MLKLSNSMRIHKVTSRENQRLVYARKVRDGKVRDLIFIEGRRLVAEALRSNVTAVECFIADNFADTELVQSIERLDIAIVATSPSLFRSIAATEQPQGIILIAKRPGTKCEIQNYRNVKVPTYLFLKEVNNPSNLGAIMRSVEAAGAGGIFVSKNSADVFSPKALRASMGAAFRVPIRADAELAEVINEAKSAGAECLALATNGSRSYLDVDWTKPHLLVYGSEAHGLTDGETKLAGEAILIPMEVQAESLNLAVAASIVLFEARRRSVK
jgi:TrmH family RNA methyltransferase